MKKILLYLMTVLVFFSCYNVSLKTNNQSEISIDELYSHISFLASDSLKGRKPGTDECRITADYIRNYFQQNDLQLMGEDGFQYFDVITTIEPGEKNHFLVKNINGILDTNYTPLAFSENASLTATVVFAGYGFDFETDSISWHDFNELDISGKWALILRGHPEMDKPQSDFDHYSDLRQKVLKAKDKGAAGVLFASGSQMDKADELISLTFDKSTATAGIPVLHIKRNLADSILKEQSLSIDSLEAQLNKTRKPNSFNIPVEVSAEIEVVKQKAKTQNVIAQIPGTDPILKDEYLIIGAHYDHLGFGGPGSGSRTPDTLAIHNGADDNASGVAGILEIAEKLVANRSNLKRSIIIISFSAEEMGLLGSKYFIANPLVELKKIKYMLNLDMIGRLDSEAKSFSVSGTGTAPALSKIMQKYAKIHTLNIEESQEGYGPSDHASFYAADIPVSMIFTGAHNDYHTPDDDTELINIKGEKIIADYVYDVIYEIANQPKALTFTEAGPKTRVSMRRRFKVTLGIMPDFAGTVKNGLRIDMVIKDRPAFRAGMKKGDVIVAMEGKTVTNIYDYMYRLKEFKVGQRISVEVVRNEKKMILIVEL